jgi:hypothetical protein
MAQTMEIVGVWRACSVLGGIVNICSPLHMAL